MNTAFLALEPEAADVTVTLDGAPLTLPAGTNLAAALLAAGVSAFRATPGSGAARGPYCMMGSCFDCLVEIDGVTRQACLTEVEEGLAIVRPRGHCRG